MNFSVSSKRFYYSLRIIGVVTAIWPLKTNASATEKLIHEIKWWIALLNVTSLLLPLILGVYHYRNDYVKMMMSLAEATVVFEASINLIQYKIKERNFQIIIGEIEHFVENGDESERNLLQKYVDKHKHVQITLGAVFIFNASMFAAAPILTSQVFPADVWYPFSIQSFFIRNFLIYTEELAVFQVGLCFSMDVIVSMMFWFCALQIELLEKKIIKAENMKDLKMCARRYQELIIFIENMIDGVRFIILKTNATMIMAIISGAFQLIYHQPLELTMRFVLLASAGCLRLFISARAADDLKENSEHLAQSTFENALFQRTPSAAKLGLMMASRFQKPIILSVGGIIKVYSLQYYGSFVSVTLKYFLSLRAVFE